jgi:hypothetical protein
MGPLPASSIPIVRVMCAAGDKCLNSLGWTPRYDNTFRNWHDNNPWRGGACF